jgi:nucleoside-diphosphate-sugar epimerase
LKILTNELGELNIIKHPPQPGDVFRTGADTSLAKTHLGFAPSYDLTAGLKNEISWLKTII